MAESSLMAALRVVETRGQGQGDGGNRSKESDGLHGDSDGMPDTHKWGDQKDRQ